MSPKPRHRIGHFAYMSGDLIGTTEHETKARIVNVFQPLIMFTDENSTYVGKDVKLQVGYLSNEMNWHGDVPSKRKEKDKDSEEHNKNQGVKKTQVQRRVKQEKGRIYR